MTLFEIGLFADVTTARRSFWIREGPKSNDKISLQETKKGNDTKTQRGECDMENGVRYWSDIATSQGMIRDVHSHPKVGETG